MAAQMMPRTREGAPSASYSFGAMPPQFRLNMAFNRLPQGRFASDVDPLAAEPLQTSSPPSVPTKEPSVAELTAELRAFKFPVRTDDVRGLLWGPFKDDPETEDEQSFQTPTNREAYKRTGIVLRPSTYAAKTARTAVKTSRTAVPTCHQRQRIFPILRAPLILRIKPTLKRRRESTEDEDTQCFRVAKAEWLGKDEDLLATDEVAIALQPICTPQRRPRITLCAASRLKYGC